MSQRPPRVAYFPDSFHEVNGVAHTSRNFLAYAERHDLPFLCVRMGAPRTGAKAVFEQHGNVQTLELPRGMASIKLEKDLDFDPLFPRYVAMVEERLKEFRPDIIHVTGPSELGIFGAYFAWEMRIAQAASWHTNVHEYAGRRASLLLKKLMPAKFADEAESQIKDGSLAVTAWFYKLAKVLYAPNEELCTLLETATGRPCRLMQRGVETKLFTPARRTRAAGDRTFVLGYVGRLSIEKNVTLLAEIERALLAAGRTDFKFVIIGQGAEEAWLREHLTHAEFAGVLRGDALAAAYADMDLLVFPSHTDTFGNVVLEALASGVPAVVTPDGGPKYIVRSGETGIVAADEEFAAAVLSLMADEARLQQMRVAAREYALGCSWDAIFDGVYAGYDSVLDEQKARG